jgi:cytochrome d ubiquinol oxidase subunit II
MPIDYAALRIIWWLLLGILLAGFAVTDGFDLGIGMLLPWSARSDSERRVVINTIGPIWEGNQVWFILGGGAIFAAWPMLYAVSFSGFYFAMLTVLLALIIRPVGFKYRSKLSQSSWRKTWDMGLWIAGLLPSLVFGVAMGNVLQGVPFYFDDSLRSFYTGSFFALLNPFALLCGLLSISMLLTHGACYLCCKTLGDIHSRTRQLALVTSILTPLLFLIAGFWVAFHLPAYQLVSAVNTQAASNPLHKTIVTAIGAWMNNYHHYPLLKIVPLLGIGASFLAFCFILSKKYRLALCANGLCIISIIATVGVSMFPFILPSSSHPDMSLLVWDSSSSADTLWIMLIATALFMPIILLYTSWVYKVMRGHVTADDIEEHSKDRY